MTALPNNCYSGCHKATEKVDDPETLGKEIWRGKCGQRASGSAGGGQSWTKTSGLYSTGNDKALSQVKQTYKQEVKGIW